MDAFSNATLLTVTYVFEVSQVIPAVTTLSPRWRSQQTAHLLNPPKVTSRIVPGLLLPHLKSTGVVPLPVTVANEGL